MSRKSLKYLVIHCTDTPAFREVTAAEILDWHLSPPPRGRGWKQVGYTDMIHLNGGVERLTKNNDDAFVDTWEITNGVKGMNSVCKHVVYVGGGNGKDTRTPSQIKALKEYVLNEIRINRDIKIAGHNQFSQKYCPSFDVPKWLHSIGIEDKNIYKP